MIFSFVIHESPKTILIRYRVIQSTPKNKLHKWGSKIIINKNGIKNKPFVSACSHNSPMLKFFDFNETQSDWDRSINKGMLDCRICDAKIKYNGKIYSKTSRGNNIEKTLIVFSHVKQPTKSKIILGRENEEISAYSRKEPASLELNPLFWWQANSYKYPLLSTVSIFILGISATSVPCERVFSTEGDIDTTQRSSLRQIQVDLLIILKKNIHN